jgi:hypothetical protein
VKAGPALDNAGPACYCSGMTNTTRTDEHSPKRFVPAHYRLLDVIDLRAGTDRDDVRALAEHTSAPHAWQEHATRSIHDRANYQELAIGERSSLAQCSICGHHIRYAVVWSYEPEGVSLGIITSGLDCAESVEATNLTELREKVGALQEFAARMRKLVRDAEAAHAEAHSQDVPADVQAFLDDHARRHVDMPEDCPACSMAVQFAERGSLTPRQVSYAQDIAARAGAVDPETGEGIEVVGLVRSVKPRGSQLFMLVDVEGRRVGLRKIAPHRVYLKVRKEVRPGTKVRFVARLEASHSDSRFLIAHDVTGQAVVESV